jgi:hypothetical protein
MLFSWLLSAFIISGCSPQVATPSPADIQTALAQTLAAEPTATEPPPTPKPTNTPPPTPTKFVAPTATPAGPISGKIAAAFLNMRSGPSTLFEIVNTYVEGTEITAIRRTPLTDWVEVTIEVEDEEPVQGWMAVLFLELDEDPSVLPEATFPLEQTIRGIVKDIEDNPIPGVASAVVLQTDEVALNTTVTSNQEGAFEVYVPEGLIGTFDVQLLSWECESPIADTNCRLSGYIILDDRSFITLPQEETIIFLFESSTLTAAGNVTDRTGKPVNGITIIAERDDGSISYGKSDILGDFIMPIGEGIWDIYTITFDPYTEGDPVQLEITETSVEDIALRSP